MAGYETVGVEVTVTEAKAATAAKTASTSGAASATHPTSLETTLVASEASAAFAPSFSHSLASSFGFDSYGGTSTGGAAEVSTGTSGVASEEAEETIALPSEEEGVLPVHYAPGVPYSINPATSPALAMVSGVDSGTPFTTPAISNIELGQVDGDGNWSVVIECTAYIDEPYCWMSQCGTLVGSLVTDITTTSHNSYFTSTTPTAASAIFSINSLTSNEVATKINGLDATEHAVHRVGSSWPTGMDDSYWGDTGWLIYPDGYLSTEYKEWAPASVGITVSDPFNSSTAGFSSAGAWVGYLFSRNIDPYLLTELENPIQTWSALADGTLSAGDLIGTDGLSDEWQDLYTYQSYLSDYTYDPGGISDVLASLRFTPVKFYFYASLSPDDLEDLAREELFLRVTFLGYDETYEVNDSTLEGASTWHHTPVSLSEALSGWRARSFNACTMGVDMANETRLSDQINIYNPNPHEINYELHEVSSPGSIVTYNKNTQAGTISAYSEEILSSANNYTTDGSLRFYRVTTTHPDDHKIKRHSGTSFSSYVYNSVISAMSIEITPDSEVTITRIPTKCVSIEARWYSKGNERSNDPLLPWGSARGYHKHDLSYLITPDLGVMYEESATFNLGIPAGGETYLVQFVFLDLYNSYIGHYDCTYTSHFPITNMTIPTIDFNVNHIVAAGGDNHYFEITEEVNRSVAEAYAEATSETTSGGGSAWSSEIDTLKTQLGVVTTYTISKKVEGSGDYQIVREGYTTSDGQIGPFEGGSDAPTTVWKFEAKVAGLADATNLTPTAETWTPGFDGNIGRTGAGTLTYQHFSQETNWPLMFWGESRPGQAFDINKFFSNIIPTQEKTIQILGTRAVNATATIESVNRNIHGQCIFVQVLITGELSTIDHIILLANVNGVKSPIITADPFDDDCIFIDYQNYDFFGTIAYTVRTVYIDGTVSDESMASTIQRFRSIDDALIT